LVEILEKEKEKEKEKQKAVGRARIVSLLLEVRNLQKHYPGRAGSVVKAVDGVSFDVAAGETFGLVGESGCGKSTVARCVLRLIPPTAGEVRFDGEDLLTASPPRMRELRKELQIVFQDPFSSLDPRMTVRSILREPLEIHKIGNRAAQDARVVELAQLVGLTESALSKYPHEFSGGQRQRIGIARALALSPRLVVADEPVSALDLSIRAQVINLMADLQAQFGLAYLFIAHDLTLVRHVCRRVAVMRAGKIVELADTETLFTDPRHPYTRRLLAAIPVPDPERTPPPLPEFDPETQMGTHWNEVSTGHFVLEP
jgi:oligopeptide transport system ATP-binding protein